MGYDMVYVPIRALVFPSHVLIKLFFDVFHEVLGGVGEVSEGASAFGFASGFEGLVDGGPYNAL